MINILITVISVSIDGFFTGVAIGLKKTIIDLKKLLIISLIPILMALPVMIIGSHITFLTNNYINIIGFILFMFMSINSFIQIKNNKTINNLSIKSSIMIGISVGLDSSICAFSLSLEKYNPFITPFYFGLSHFLLIWLGNYLFNKIDITKINYLKYLSPILFMLIAIFKLF